jgi:hypothetical protein
MFKRLNLYKMNDIIELIIDENDIDAGLDGIALVNKPAIEVDFHFFNKEEDTNKCNHYVLSEEETPKVIEMFASYGETQSDLINQGFKIVKVRDIGKQLFADISAEPNKDSDIADTPTVRIRYKYVGPKDEKNRVFCGEMMTLNRVFRREDIITMSNKSVNEIGPDGYDIFEWRGSYNCRHRWVELTYVKEGTIINSAKVTRGLITEKNVPGPDTRTDATIAAGNTPARNAFTDELYQFEESITDYPQYIKDNAAKALKWFKDNDNPNNCMTQVGKVRMNQLAKGEPISINTIKRMKSFLSRHKVDLESSKSYEDGCGLLSIDAWGGIEALDWATKYLDRMENEDTANMQEFAIVDDEKKLLVGPAMIPNKMMARKDFATNNIYFVYFSEETIEKLQRKFMRNKLLDAANVEHKNEFIEDVTVVESWIVEDATFDKQKKYGFDNPIGTWMIIMKINNDEIWDKVKSGDLKGFSVQGYFAEKKVQI